MFRQLRRHRFYLGSLLLIQLFCLLLILAANGNEALQMKFVVLAALAYVIWGFVHHKIHHDLHAKVVIEYVLMGFLGIAIIYFLLQ